MGEEVAIIGAGPAGLVAARFLKQHGFAPVLIDGHDGIGGQWNTSNPKSGIWPEMRTNTSKITTQFSDMDFPANVGMFPRNSEMLAYLKAYADHFGLLDGALLNTRVVAVSRVTDGYGLLLESDKQKTERIFHKVIVATGRYNRPTMPKVDGIESFSGELGVRHAFYYKNPEEFRGRHVLVAGGSISALEIASDLSMLGSRSVHLAQRRQRYVLPKMVQGIPLEYYAFSRHGARVRDTATQTELNAAQQDFVLRYGGDPSRYGAPKPHRDISKAGFTGSQHYLNLVAEDRLTVKPWIVNVNGRTVTFTDGSTAEVDAILMGTGFDLDLDILSPDISAVVANDAKGLRLANFSFHPDLPGLAFMGLWAQQGPYPVALEQQARYIAYRWAGILDVSGSADLQAALAACQSEGHHSDYRDQNEMALRFARLCGCDPVGVGDAAFQRMLDASATTAIMFRMTGADSLPDAQQRFRDQFRTYGPPQLAVA